MEKTKLCEFCGKEFIIINNNSKYCSVDCRKKARKQREQERRENKPVKEKDAIAFLEAQKKKYNCPHPHECQYSKTTGAWVYCDYFSKVGKLRGGYACDCDKFEPKHKKVLQNNGL